MKIKTLTFYILNFAFSICMAQTAPWDGLRGGAPVVTNEQDAVAMAEIARATNGIPAKIAAATNGMPERIEQAVAAESNRVDMTFARKSEIPNMPDLSPYALKTEIPDMPDLTPYALKSELPPTPDLSGYATKYEVELATNDIPAQIAASTNGLPAKIAAVTNGIPAKIAAATNGLPEKIAAAESSALRAAREGTNYTDSVAGRLSARMQEMSMAFATSNTATRLSTPDGETFQDATGVVWRVENFQVPGLFNFQAIMYFTNGVYMAETNELPAGINWTMWEDYDNGTWEIIAGESARAENPEERYGEWVEFTNHVDAADMGDLGTFYYIMQLEIAGEETELMTTENMDAPTVTIEWPMSNTNVARFLMFARTNVTAKVLTPIDRVLHASEGSAAGDYEIVSNRAMNAIQVETDPTVPAWAKSETPPASMTTNIVCDIVTNEIPSGYTDWVCVPPLGGDYEIIYSDDSWCVSSEEHGGVISIAKYHNKPDALSISFGADEWQGGVAFTATRTYNEAHNALGLASLVDLPPLTNEIPTLISKGTASAVQISTNYTAAALVGYAATSNVVPAKSIDGYAIATNVAVDVGYGIPFLLLNDSGVEYTSMLKPASILPYDYTWKLPTSYDIDKVEMTLVDNYALADSTNALHTSLASTIFAATDAATNYTDSATNAVLMSALSADISTNDVCAIVTNEVVEFAAWKWDAAGTSAGLGQPEYGVVGDWWTVDYEGMPWPATERSETATELHFDIGMDELDEAVATLTLFTRNALGLARLTDLPPLTNGLATSSEIASATNAVLTAALSAAMTTNDVCNIVTNEIPSGYTDWVCVPPLGGDYEIIYSDDSWCVSSEEYGGVVSIGKYYNEPDAVSISFGADEWTGRMAFTATRTYHEAYNALGLASLVDLPPLTNGVASDIAASAIAATNYTDSAVASSTNSVFQKIKYDRLYRITAIENSDEVIYYGRIMSYVGGSIMFYGTLNSVSGPTYTSTFIDYVNYYFFALEIDLSKTGDISSAYAASLYFSDAWCYAGGNEVPANREIMMSTTNITFEIAEEVAMPMRGKSSAKTTGQRRRIATKEKETTNTVTVAVEANAR